ncbi:MAG: S8 family serine peptidase [Phycisphaerales bacterium]|nr:S8 family serine peptidase [Phycisphaerales bacterium]
MACVLAIRPRTLPAALALVAGAALACAQPALELRASRVRLADVPNLARERAISHSDAPRILVLDGPMTPYRDAALRKAGVQVRDHLDGDAFLASIPAGTAKRLEKLSFVASIADFKPEWKLAPEISARAAALARGGDSARRANRNFRDSARLALERASKLGLIVSLMPGSDPDQARTRLSSIRGVQVLRIDNAGGDLLATVTAPAAALPAISAVPLVHFVEEFPEFEDRLSTARWVVQTNVANSTPLYAAGLNGSGQIMGIVEASTSPLFTHCSFADPESDPIGPNHRKIVAYFASSPARPTGLHATHVSGIAIGDAGLDDDTRGVAYGARMAFANGLALNESVIFNLFAANRTAGAFVHNNSWGNSGTNAYDVTCRAIDNFQWLNSDCLLLQATNESFTPLTNPENAKNSLAIVASGDTPNQESLFYGGLGPTTDGRRKPDMAAPGSGIIAPSNSGPCATISQNGTSMSTPMVSAMGVIYRQYFTQGYYPTGTATPANAFTPSGPLLKAMLINSAVRMGTQASYPDNRGGWGRLLADRAVHLPGNTRTLLVRDALNASVGALTTGQSRTFRFVVKPGSEDLRITMAFHDAPGAVSSANPVVNNLDLSTIAPGGSTLLGNVFSNGWSAAGGSADAINTVEQIMIQSPAPGVWFARINAAAVNVGQQGYGLVITGNVAEATCICDLNVDGVVDDLDFQLFAVAYDNLLDPLGDFNNDGVTDDADFSTFAPAYDTLLCP